jgi:hypothetical protein
MAYAIVKSRPSCQKRPENYPSTPAYFLNFFCAVDWRKCLKFNPGTPIILPILSALWKPGYLYWYPKKFSKNSFFFFTFFSICLIFCLTIRPYAEVGGRILKLRFCEFLLCVALPMACISLYTLNLGVSFKSPQLAQIFRLVPYSAGNCFENPVIIGLSGMQPKQNCTLKYSKNDMLNR